MARKVYEKNIRSMLKEKNVRLLMGKARLTPLQMQNLLKSRLDLSTSKSQKVINTKKQVISRSLISRDIRKKPVKAKMAITNNSLQSLIDLPSTSGDVSSDFPVPDWFLFQGKADVSVIVPLYKSNKVVNDLIASWDVYNDGLKVEMIFVDDQCPNDSKTAVIKSWELRKNEITQGVGRIIINGSNQGFGGACNAGAFKATGDYIIYLNADTRVTNGWIKPIIDLFNSDSKIGIIGNLQIKEGGVWNNTIDSAGSEWIWRKDGFIHIGRHCYHYQDLPRPFTYTESPSDILQVAEREMVTGCCLAIRTTLNQYIGGFNPCYRIGYWEDSELCMAVKEKGYKIMYQPKSIIFHKLSHANMGCHPYHIANKVYFFNKWVKSGRIDALVHEPRPDALPEIKQILLQRKEATGDVLVATAVVPALKKKYPGCQITFNTRSTNVLLNNPNIDSVVNEGEFSERQFQLVYNLDMAYERRPYTNILQSYADVVGVPVSNCKTFVAQETIADFNLSQYVVFHAGKTLWAGRDWTQDKMIELALQLMANGENVVLVGKSNDYHIPSSYDLRGQTNIQQLAFLIANAKLFIGIDSFPMHVAQSVNTPGVCFFGSIDPHTRIYNNCIIPVTAKNVDCLGCHHRRQSPCVVTNFCENNTFDCIKKCSVDDMWNVVTQQLKQYG